MSRSDAESPRRGQGRARAAVGLRQDGDRRLRPRPRRARDRDRLDRRDGARAGRGRRSRCARSPTSPASRRSWTGGSRRFTPSSTRGCSRVRDDPDHMQAAERARRRADRPRVRQPLSVRADRRRRRSVDDAEVIENIDIGGPTMIRAAAKNFAFVAPVVSPESYDAVLAELRESDRRLSLPTRESLAAEAFAYTARYDTAIARWFQERREDFPPLMVRAFEKVLDLPYGENPHQRAAYYSQVGARTHLLSMVSQLGGKELSFNNLLDLDARAAADRRVPGPGVRDRQAQQPVRGGGRRERARRLPAGVRLRPDVRLRRGHLPEPTRRPRAGGGGRRAVRRGAVRARVRRRRARGARRPSTTCGSSTTASAAAWQPARAEPAPGRRRDARPGSRRRLRGARGDAGGRPSASRPTPNGRTCCSPGGSASTSARTRS